MPPVAACRGAVDRERAGGRGRDAEQCPDGGGLAGAVAAGRPKVSPGAMSNDSPSTRCGPRTASRSPAPRCSPHSCRRPYRRRLDVRHLPNGKHLQDGERRGEPMTEIQPTEARALLTRADRLARRAHDAVRWPYVTFIVALGGTTSLGTFAMGLGTGGRSAPRTSAASPWSWCRAVVHHRHRGRSAFARGRRWRTYIAAWTVTYCAAIAVVAWVPRLGALAA